MGIYSYIYIYDIYVRLKEIMIPLLLLLLLLLNPNQQQQQQQPRTKDLEWAILIVLHRPYPGCPRLPMGRDWGGGVSKVPWKGQKANSVIGSTPNWTSKTSGNKLSFFPFFIIVKSVASTLPFMPRAPN